MMNHLRFETLGQLAATLGLVVSCGGDVRNLGSDAGGANSATGGSAAVATGGSPAVATGGSGIADIGIGGWLSTGGQSNTGGETSTGGQSSVTPYITDPTLPIDPTCTCDSSDKICNAARECVPRCDDAGRCARWLANHAVKDLFVEGTSLYYLVAATTDPLGNPNADGALYRVETTSGTPTLIAGSLGSPYKILGRYKNTTVIEVGIDPATTIISVSDAAVTSTLAQCGGDAAMWGHWIAYVDPSLSTLMGIDLDGNLEPLALAEKAPAASYLSLRTVLDDAVLFATSNGYLCSIQLSNPALGADCTSANCNQAVASSGDQFYCWIYGVVTSYVPPYTAVKALYRAHDPTIQGRMVYANGWLYLDDIWDQSSFASSLGRVPITVGRLPQQILPDDLVLRHSTYSDGSISPIVFGVGASDIFWIQNLLASDSNQPQYIFSAPLPPQPCDADLPCADSTLTCTNGFCGPA